MRRSFKKLKSFGSLPFLFLLTFNAMCIQWIFDDVNNWIHARGQDLQAGTANTKNKLYWLCGSGGTGKSVVTAELLHRLEAETQVAAYHFCR